MRQRCKGNTGRHRHYYASRGITVCERWESFDSFLADMGERPEGTTLDRIDGTKGYEPSNCRWATNKTQGDNRACVEQITYNGKTQNPEDWARELGIKPQTLRSRFARGWHLDRVMTKAPKRGTPGETGRHKITEAVAREILATKPRGKAAAALAASLGVGIGTIHAVIAGRSWKHLREAQ